jgi:beta-glucosidase
MIDRRAFIAAAAAASAAPALAARNRAFPKGFLWGAATAAHQVEGNNVNSDIWALEHVTPTVYAEPSGDAANSFELWPTDLDLVRTMGLNAYRFSLEWARIEPEPGQFSIAMLDHYKRMILGCRARGIEPVVTFNHFTTPRWFAMRGGWTSAEAPDLFARYCDRAARHLATDIGHATTLNEPNLAGLLHLVLPPGLGDILLTADRAMSEAAARQYGVAKFYAGNSLWTDAPQTVSAHLLAAHEAGRAAIKAARGDLPVGVSLAIVDDQAAGPDSLRDTMRETLYGPWLRAARSDDFVGVQNYERAIWTAEGRMPPPPGAMLNAMGSEIYPPSLAGAVRHAHAVAGVPVIVTEHGVNSPDDRVRAALIPAALAELARAIADGVPVKGYCHWSLVDNFEWVFGYKPQFGLHSLDRASFARTPKPSAAILGAIARRNAVR